MMGLMKDTHVNEIETILNQFESMAIPDNMTNETTILCILILKKIKR